MPQRIGDSEWTKWFDVASEPKATIDDWILWAVIQRLVETYDTTETAALALENGTYWFDFTSDET